MIYNHEAASVRDLELRLEEHLSTLSFKPLIREITDPQLQLGEQMFGAIGLDHRSRDDIPPLLRGLQYVYVTAEVRERVFVILAERMPTVRGR